MAQFQNMKLLSCDEGAATFRAVWEGEDVIVKKCDIWKQPEVADEILHEAYVYSSLKEIQGRFIPTMMLEGVSDGIEMVLVTNYAGANIAHRILTTADCDKIREAIVAVHNLGVVHGDIRPQNIVAQEIEGNVRFTVIDFGLSRWTQDESEFEQEMKRLEGVLDSLTH
jgi:tRNA A-37 threonylcarbamoyl transferase component Bud32